MVTFRSAVAVALTTTLATSSCYSWDNWQRYSAAPTFESERPILVGSQGALQATIDDSSINVSLLDAPLCKVGQFGHMVVRESRSASLSALSYLTWEVFALGIFGGGIALLAKAPTNALDEPSNSYEIPGIIGLSLGFSGAAVVPFIATPWFLSHTKTELRESPGEPASEWKDGSATPCLNETASGAHATIELSAEFQRGSQAIHWHLDTDENGRATFAVRAQIEGIIKYCGPATVTVTDSRGASSSDYFGDSPTATQLRHRPAQAVTLSISGNHGTALEEVPGFAKTLAAECKADRLSTCVVRMSRETREGFQQSCEEECGEKVEAMQCIFANRNCTAQADGTDAERALCNNGYRQCLLEASVKPESLEACVNKCVDGKKTAACL